MTQFILREFSNQKNLPNKQQKSCKVQTVYVFHTPYTQCTKKEREKIKYLIECRWVKWLKVVKMNFFKKKNQPHFIANLIRIFVFVDDSTSCSFLDIYWRWYHGIFTIKQFIIFISFFLWIRSVRESIACILHHTTTNCRRTHK